MSSPPAPPPSPPGIELAYDTAAKKLKDQIAAIEQLDTKAGIAIAALAAAVAGFVALDLSTLDRIAGGVLLGVAIVAALLVFFVRPYSDAPDPSVFAHYAGYQSAYMKELFLQALLQAHQSNQDRIRWKVRFLNVLFGALALLGLLAVVTRAAGLAR